MRLALLYAVLVVAATPALAFDCTKASAPVEQAICADPALKASDDAMSAAYGAARTRLDAAGKAALRGLQLDWIKLRDGRCTGWDAAAAVDRQCLGEEIADRTALLTAAPLHAAPGAPRFSPVFFRLVDEKADIDIGLVYPQVVDPETPAMAALNRYLAARGAVDQVEGPYGRTLTYRIGYASGQFVSVRFDGYEYTGGAHGMGFTGGVNFLPERGRLLEIADLLDRRGQKALTAHCRARLADEKRRREVPEELIADALNDEALSIGITEPRFWTFDDRGAAIHYGPYELGSYAEGSYECAVPWPDLSAFAKPDAPLPLE